MIRLTVIFFTARRYASAVYAVVVCPAVCHKPGLYRNDWIYIAGFLARELLLTYPKLCYKKIRVSPKIRALPSGTLPQIPDVENFATASRCRACGLHLRRSSASWLGAQSLLHIGLLVSSWSPLLRFVLDLIYNLFLHCCAAVGKVLTNTSRRVVRLR